jgi:putative membrane protein
MQRSMGIPSAVLLGAVITSAVHAESFGNPAGLSPDSPGLEASSPRPDHANSQDKLFVRQATLGGQAEVEFGRLAQKKGSADAVKKFGERMVDDHSKAGERLAGLARGLNPNIPKELDPEHRTVREQLTKTSGKDFDIAYLTTQIEDHQRTANLLMWEISMGQNEALKKFAAEQLPVVLDHLEMAKQHFAEVTAASPPR